MRRQIRKYFIYSDRVFFSGLAENLNEVQCFRVNQLRINVAVAWIDSLSNMQRNNKKSRQYFFSPPFNVCRMKWNTLGRIFLSFFFFFSSQNPCNLFSSGPKYTQLSTKQTNQDMKLVITGEIKSKWLTARADMSNNVCVCPILCGPSLNRQCNRANSKTLVREQFRIN